MLAVVVLLCPSIKGGICFRHGVQDKGHSGYRGNDEVNEKNMN